MDCCQKLFTIPLRILCLILLITQLGLLDVYLATYINKIWLTWIIADVVTVGLFITVLVLSYIYSHRENFQPETFQRISKAGKLPLIYIAWGVYCFVLFLKVLFCFEKFAAKLSETDFWGPNTLKFTLALSAPLFLIYLLSQISTTSDNENRKYMDKLTSGVTFDIFDTVDILNILFVQESRVLLSFAMSKSILVISLINIFMSLIPLFLVSYSHYGKIKLRESVMTLYRILMILVVNLPYLVIRLRLIHFYGVNMSVFLIKNFLSIFVTFYDIYEKRQLEKLEKAFARASPETRAEGTALEDRA